jgi:Domain of unknown function (DUF4190)
MTGTPPEEPDRGPAPPPPPPQPATPSYSAGGTSGTPKTNGLAIASLVCGIVGCFWITAIVAIVLGFIARNQIRESSGTQQGDGMALAGIILGFVWVGLGIIQFGFVLT